MSVKLISLRILTGFLALSLLLGGCADNNAEAAPQILSADAASSAAVTRSLPPVNAPDPQAALDEIYSAIDVKGVGPATDSVMENKFFFDLDDLDDYDVRYASGRYGVADVFILKPAADKLPDVRETLEQVKINRIKEFENYDIYDSLRIANDAEIFEQGDYLVMLMVDNLDEAREIIEHFLPD